MLECLQGDSGPRALEDGRGAGLKRRKLSAKSRGACLGTLGESKRGQASGELTEVLNFKPQLKKVNWRLIATVFVVVDETGPLNPNSYE